MRIDDAARRIVIAEDESISRMDLREMLANLGYLVVGEAADGQSAVNLARELRPELVIMDIKMPEMDGITAAKLLTEEIVYFTQYVLWGERVIKDVAEHELSTTRTCLG